jgi:uroporphyrinogen decarboxylase
VITIENDTFLRAARGQRTSRTPIWMMRQAGRVLPEYRAVREKHSFLDVARIPELCAEVTVQPVERLDVDAAILFSDILLPFAAMGIGVDFQPGPVLERAYDPEAGLSQLRLPDPAHDYAFLADCVRATNERLAGRVPLIGFAGAPFTLATYLVEGGSSKNYDRTRAWMFSDPDGFRAFLFFLADRIAEWLQVQVDAGVRAFQLFDSWAGTLATEEMTAFALPAASRVFRAVRTPDDMPRIYFAPGSGMSWEAQSQCGCTVLGVDWRTSLAELRAKRPSLPLQGNLDPGVLLGSQETIRRKVERILADVGDGGGHVFNLGHGVLPQTPLENAEYVVRVVHELSEENRR